jgi:methyl-accepting chemotaxis protein
MTAMVVFWFLLNGPAWAESRQYHYPENRELVALVRDAAQLVRTEGEAAFPVLRDKSSGFIFQDTYVFVNNAKRVELVNPMFPRREGKCLWDLRDAKGNFAIRDMVKTVKDQGEAWLESEWPKPGENLPSIKPTFVKGITVAGELLIVGCGVYLD